MEEVTSEPNLDQDVNFTGERLQKQKETSPVRQEAHDSHDWRRRTAEIVGCSNLAWSFLMALTHNHKYGGSEAFKRAGANLRLWLICVICVDAQMTQGDLILCWFWGNKELENSLVGTCRHYTDVSSHYRPQTSPVVVLSCISQIVFSKKCTI